MPDRYIPGVPCWIDTNQPDAEAAVAFYSGLFGWEIEDAMPPESDRHYFMARIRGGDVAGISPVPEGAPQIAKWDTYIWVQSADETAAKVKAAGGTVVMEPMDVMDAGRTAVVSDPEGAVFCLWEPKRHRGAAIVNEAGSVNFNNMNTHDADAAKAFYGEVFGWGTIPMGGGAEAWTLPGYGDHLELLNPGTRERMASMGAPEGFIDVVATLTPLPDHDGDVPPHWSVTFATDDVDVTARKASELGGQVVAGPFDAPWVRMAVITDPQGASFIASQFVPENRDLRTAVGSGQAPTG
ncbi:MAG TPA: VOC family protein [Solirubrobacteraceae bacterium]|nr:VOC family protein [Solirubrobacteraceae bacterium]